MSSLNNLVYYDRLKDMDESFRLLVDFSEYNDILDVYIYNLIATLVLSSKRNETNDSIDNDFNLKILSLLREADENDEIKMKSADLNYFINEIEYRRISNLLNDILLLKVIIKLSEIDLEYQLNLCNHDEDEIRVLKNKVNELELMHKKVEQYVDIIYGKLIQNNNLTGDVNDLLKINFNDVYDYPENANTRKI